MNLSAIELRSVRRHVLAVKAGRRFVAVTRIIDCCQTLHDEYLYKNGHDPAQFTWDSPQLM